MACQSIPESPDRPRRARVQIGAPVPDADLHIVAYNPSDLLGDRARPGTYGWTMAYERVRAGFAKRVIRIFFQSAARYV